MRLKVQTIKTLVWLGCAIAGAAILGLLTYIFLRVVPEIQDKSKKRQKDLSSRIQKAVSVSPTIKARERAQAINWPELDNLHKLNVTGKEPPPPPERTDSTDENAPPPLKPIAEVITVRSVIAIDGAPTRGYATIAYVGDPDPPINPPPVPVSGVVPQKQARHKPQVSGGYITVGDTLRDPYDKPPFSAKVVAVLNEGVEFEWGGERVIVSPPLMAPIDPDPETMPGLDDAEAVDVTGGGAGTDVAPQRAPRVPQAETTAVNDNDWYIGTDEMARIEKEGESLLNEIELSITTPKNDKRPRLQMKVVPEGTLAHQRGFRSGDFLRTINGEDMSQKSSIVDYIKRNPKQSVFSVEIERLGTRITKVFTLAR